MYIPPDDVGLSVSTNLDGRGRILFGGIAGKKFLAGGGGGCGTGEGRMPLPPELSEVKSHDLNFASYRKWLTWGSENLIVTLSYTSHHSSRGLLAHVAEAVGTPPACAIVSIAVLSTRKPH